MSITSKIRDAISKKVLCRCITSFGNEHAVYDATEAYWFSASDAAEYQRAGFIRQIPDPSFEADLAKHEMGGR